MKRVVEILEGIREELGELNETLREIRLELQWMNQRPR